MNLTCYKLQNSFMFSGWIFVVPSLVDDDCGFIKCEEYKTLLNKEPSRMKRISFMNTFCLITLSMHNKEQSLTFTLICIYIYF